MRRPMSIATWVVIVGLVILSWFARPADAHCGDGNCWAEQVYAPLVFIPAAPALEKAPCTIDWTLPDSTDNYLEILRCDRELHPPDGLRPLCPPSWSEWVFHLNVGICYAVVDGTAMPLPPALVTPAPYP